jgi:hypothetical protein
MNIAFVIPTSKSNFEDCLSELLYSLDLSIKKGARNHRISVTIVINGNSSSRINCPDGLPVHVVKEDREGLVFGRHRGILENPSADYYVFLDDDVLLGEPYIDGVDEVLRIDSQLATGALNPLWEVEPPDWIMDWYVRGSPWPNLPHLSIMSPPSDIKFIDPMFVWGANFIVSRKLLLDCGGFHPDGFPESKIILRGDGETHVAQVFKSAGCQAAYNHKLSVYHRVPRARLSVEYFIKRMLMEGIGSSFCDVRQGGEVCVPAGFESIGPLGFNELIEIAMILSTKDGSLNLTAVEKTARSLGYYWHQLAARANPIITSWCRKENYFLS